MGRVMKEVGGRKRKKKDRGKREARGCGHTVM